MKQGFAIAALFLLSAVSRHHQIQPTGLPAEPDPGPTDYIVGFRFENVYADDEFVTVHVKYSAVGSDQVFGRVQVKELLHVVNITTDDRGVEVAPRFNALEVKRTLRAVVFGAGVDMMLVSDAGKRSGARAITIYKWGQ